MSSSSSRPPVYGGRALANGVLMVGPGAMAVAVRRSDGTISTESEPFTAPLGWARGIPFLRGLAAVAGALVLASKSVGLERRMADDEEGGRRRQMLQMVAPAIVVTVIERVLRSIIVGRKQPEAMKRSPGPLLMFMPLVAMRLSGFFPPGRRLLQYHAAEHMAVNAVEAGNEPTPEAASIQSRIHPRCGTSFAVWTMILGWALGAGRKRGLIRNVVAVAGVVAVAYELLFFGARNRQEPWVKVVYGPVWQAQRLTTLPPDREHLEVSCAALAAVIAHGEPEPSTTPTSLA